LSVKRNLSTTTNLKFAGGKFSLIPAPLLPFHRDIYDDVMRVTDMAESYRDLLSDALDAYMSIVGNRMNEIMKVLTIFSAVMLPLTFHLDAPRRQVAF